MPIVPFPPHYKLISGISKGVKVPNERATTPCVIKLGTLSIAFERARH